MLCGFKARFANSTRFYFIKKPLDLLCGFWGKWNEPSQKESLESRWWFPSLGLSRGHAVFWSAGARGSTRMGLAGEGDFSVSLLGSSFGKDQSHRPLICGHLQELPVLPAELLMARWDLSSITQQVFQAETWPRGISFGSVLLPISAAVWVCWRDSSWFVAKFTFEIKLH